MSKAEFLTAMGERMATAANSGDGDNLDRIVNYTVAEGGVTKKEALRAGDEACRRRSGKRK